MWCIRVCTVACYSIADSLVRFEPVTEDPGPVWIRVRYEPDTLAIRGATHRTIHRSVLVRAVKIRWRFRSETALCHVSICFYWVFRCYSIGRERSSCLFTLMRIVLLSFHVSELLFSSSMNSILYLNLLMMIYTIDHCFMFTYVQHK